MAAKSWITDPYLEATLAGAVEAGPRISVVGLIDTGASSICVDKRIAVQLGLRAIRRKPMEMADGTVTVATIYMARMRVPELDFEDWVPVSAVLMEAPNFRILLGRSFLRRYWVTYHGPEERFHFSYPPQEYSEDLDG